MKKLKYIKTIFCSILIFSSPVWAGESTECQIESNNLVAMSSIEGLQENFYCYSPDNNPALLSCSGLNLSFAHEIRKKLRKKKRRLKVRLLKNKKRKVRIRYRSTRKLLKTIRKAEVECEGSGLPDTTVVPAPGYQTAEIPELQSWEDNMLSYGKKHCEFLKSGNGSKDERLRAVYYDAQYVFYNIYGYTGDRYWKGCAEVAESIYRDDYAVAGGGKVPGYWNFTHGLREDYLRTGDQKSREALILISQNAAFARESTHAWETEDASVSREAAYAIMSYLNAEAVGEVERQRLSLLVNHALGHIDQWCISETASYVQPFMMGLTSHALIEYYNKTNDNRIIPALITMADWLWEHSWIAEEKAFWYISSNISNDGAAPDLNLLISPVYAWLFYQTGELRFQSRGDQIFAGGVTQTWLLGAKQFNQNYRMSFDFVRWRTKR